MNTQEGSHQFVTVIYIYDFFSFHLLVLHIIFKIKFAIFRCNSIFKNYQQNNRNQIC